MIGRASLGNPWIFKEIIENLSNIDKHGGVLLNKIDVSPNDKKEVMKEHFKLLLEQKGEYTATREIRKHVAWYIKGMPGSAKIKDLCNRQTNFEDVSKIIFNASIFLTPPVNQP